MYNIHHKTLCALLSLIRPDPPQPHTLNTNPKAPNQVEKAGFSMFSLLNPNPKPRSPITPQGPTLEMPSDQAVPFFDFPFSWAHLAFRVELPGLKSRAADGFQALGVWAYVLDSGK